MSGKAWILPLGLVAALGAYLFLLHGTVDRFALGFLSAVGLGIALLVPEIALHMFIVFSNVAVPLIPGVASAAKLAGFICCLAFLGVLFARRGSVWLGGAGFWLMLGLVAVGGLSCLKADRLGEALFAAIHLGFALVAYLLFVNIVDSLDRFRRVLNVIILSVIANSLTGLYQFFVLDEYRAEGLIGQANGLGWICVFTLPFCYGFIVETRGIRRIGYYLGGFVIILGLITSVSRAAFLGFLLSITLFSLKGRGRGLIYLILPLSVYLFSLSPFIPERYWERMQSIVEGEGEGPNKSILENPRVYFLKAGIHMWRENPVLGVGLNNFKNNFAFQYNPGLEPGNEMVSHSLYVQTLAETGSLGMIALSSLLVWAFFVLRTTQRRVRDVATDAVRKYLAGLEVGFIVFLFVSNFSGGLLHYWNFVIVGMMATPRRIFTGLAVEGRMEPAAESTLEAFRSPEEGEREFVPRPWPGVRPLPGAPVGRER